LSGDSFLWSPPPFFLWPLFGYSFTLFFDFSPLGTPFLRIRAFPFYVVLPLLIHIGLFLPIASVPFFFFYRTAQPPGGIGTLFFRTGTSPPPLFFGLTTFFFGSRDTCPEGRRCCYLFFFRCLVLLFLYSKCEYDSSLFAPVLLHWYFCLDIPTSSDLYFPHG